MQIQRIFVSNYKNLVDCELFPKGIHALTGCNGSGKTNFLEIFQFIAALHSSDDDFRESLLVDGNCPSGGEWFPMIPNDQLTKPFHFELDCALRIKKDNWIVKYVLTLEKPNKGDGLYDQFGAGNISREVISIKQEGKTGPFRLVLDRSESGDVTASPETSSRQQTKFKTKTNMSALHALEVREADSFSDEYPVLAEFRGGILSSAIVKLNPEGIISASDPYSSKKIKKRAPGRSVRVFSLYDSLKSIENRGSDWEEFKYWLKILCDIKNVLLNENEADESKSKLKTGKFVILHRQGQVLFPKELSTGNIMLLGLVTALFSFLRDSGVIILEEPESYIHPKALIDLINLLRTVSEVKTVLFSTHSTVALNSMNSSEVTLLKPLGGGMHTSINVSEIDEAAKALNRGYMSFGDLLQTNFMTD